MDPPLLNFRPIFPTSESNNSSHLFRSSAVNETLHESVKCLREKFGIKSIFDLREKREYFPNSAFKNFYKFQDSFEPDQTLRQSDRFSQTLFYRYRLNLFTTSCLWNIIWFRLKWNQILKLLFWFIFSMIYKSNGLYLYLNRCYIFQMSLGKGYCAILDDCQKNFKKIFSLLLNKENFPILICCSYGKDRTGILAALIMKLVGSDDDLIAEQYSQSDIHLKPIYPRLLKELNYFGFKEEFAQCPPEAIKEVLLHLQTNYGGAEGYLRCCGMTNEQIEEIKKNVTPKKIE